MAIVYKDINDFVKKSSIGGGEKLPVSDTEFITPNQITEKLDLGSRTETNFTGPWEVGYVIYSSGEISGNSNYNHAEFSVEEGTIIKLRTDASSAAAIIAAYNSNNVYQKSLSVPGTGTVSEYEYVVPSGVTKVIVTVYNNASYKNIKIYGPLYSAMKKYVDDTVGNIETILASI